MEFRRRSDIYRCVNSYVASVTKDDVTATPQEFALAAFHAEPEVERDIMSALVEDIVTALSDGNCVAYGVARRDFEDFAAITIGAPYSK